jgi:hypothetical protein
MPFSNVVQVHGRARLDQLPSVDLNRPGSRPAGLGSISSLLLTSIGQVHGRARLDQLTSVDLNREQDVVRLVVAVQNFDSVFKIGRNSACGT